MIQVRFEPSQITILDVFFLEFCDTSRLYFELAQYTS